MATNFPTSLDSLTNPTSGDSLSSPSHSAQHANVNDAVEALQAKVGVDGSAVTSSLDYQVNVALPAGIVGYATKTTNTALTTSPTTVLTVTATLKAGRNYFIGFSGYTFAASTTQNILVSLEVDGTRVKATYPISNTTINHVDLTLFMNYVPASDQTSVPVTAVALVSAGTNSISGQSTSPHLLVVYDMGA